MFAHNVHVVVSFDVNSGINHPLGTRGAKNDKRLLQRSVISLGMFVLLLVAVGALSLVTRAQNVVAHPGVCLGGWGGSQRASGTPEYYDGVVPSELTAAVLPENTAADIFCSTFEAEVPENSFPTRLALEVVLARAPVSSPEALEDTQLLTPPEPVEFPGGGDEVLPASTPSPGESSEGFENPEPSVEVPESEEPSAWMRLLFGVAHAEELAPIEAVPASNEVEVPLEVEPQEPPAEPTILSEVNVFTPPAADESEGENQVPETVPLEETTEGEAVLETGAIVPLSAFDEASVLPDEAQSDALVGTELAQVTSSLPGNDPLVEVLLTFDGVVWETLGTLSEEGFSDARFEIAIPDDFDWRTLSQIQVLVRPVITPISRPALLLDGVAIVVEYEKLSPDVAPLALLLSEDKTFSLANRFLSDIKAARGYALVKTVTADARTELFVIPLDGERPPLRIANELWIAPESPIGIFNGFAFWVSPQGEVFGFSLSRSRFIPTSFVRESADNVGEFNPDSLSFGVTLRGSEFAFRDGVRGEVTSEDDAELKAQFVELVFDDVPDRDDLRDLHLIPAPESEVISEVP